MLRLKRWPAGLNIRRSLLAIVFAFVFLALPTFAVVPIYTSPPLSPLQRKRLVDILDRRWEWAPMELGSRKQRAVKLPVGIVLLEIICREDGTMMDQALLTADAKHTP